MGNQRDYNKPDYGLLELEVDQGRYAPGEMPEHDWGDGSGSGSSNPANDEGPSGGPGGGQDPGADLPPGSYSDTSIGGAVDPGAVDVGKDPEDMVAPSSTSTGTDPAAIDVGAQEGRYNYEVGPGNEEGTEKEVGASTTYSSTSDVANEPATFSAKHDSGKGDPSSTDVGDVPSSTPDVDGSTDMINTQVYEPADSSSMENPTIAAESQTPGLGDAEFVSNQAKVNPGEGQDTSSPAASVLHGKQEDGKDQEPECFEKADDPRPNFKHLDREHWESNEDEAHFRAEGNLQDFDPNWREKNQEYLDGLRLGGPWGAAATLISGDGAWGKMLGGLVRAFAGAVGPSTTTTIDPNNTNPSPGYHDRPQP